MTHSLFVFCLWFPCIPLCGHASLFDDVNWLLHLGENFWNMFNEHYKNQPSNKHTSESSWFSSLFKEIQSSWTLEEISTYCFNCHRKLPIKHLVRCIFFFHPFFFLDRQSYSVVATLCAFLANCTKCFHAEYFRCEMENAKKLIALHRPESSFCVRCCCCHICWKLLRAVDNFVFITRQTKTNGNRNDEEREKKELFPVFLLYFTSISHFYALA